jgi:uncharacterized caspase-like protein
MSAITVEQINITYNKNVAALQNYCNNLILNIQRSSLRLALKTQRINATKVYYNHTLKALTVKRDNDLKLAKTQKYTALLIGIDYKGTQYKLNGCINDVKSMTEYLISKKIPSDKILALTDDTDVKPTKINIINSLKKLLNDASSGDQLVFFFSGHGSSIRNPPQKNKEEIDEVLVTLELNDIIDDDLNAIIQANLKPNVKLFVMFDCCHSGTMLDLKYTYPMVDGNMNVVVDETSTGDTKSQVFYIGGSKDEQVSMDAYINSKSQGAFTWAFLEAVKSNSNVSWSELVGNIRNNLNKYQFAQIPQFSSGLPCDVKSFWCFAK